MFENSNHGKEFPCLQKMSSTVTNFVSWNLVVAVTYWNQPKWPLALFLMDSW